MSGRERANSDSGSTTRQFVLRGLENRLILRELELRAVRARAARQQQVQDVTGIDFDAEDGYGGSGADDSNGSNASPLVSSLNAGPAAKPRGVAAGTCRSCRCRPPRRLRDTWRLVVSDPVWWGNNLNLALMTLYVFMDQASAWLYEPAQLPVTNALWWLAGAWYVADCYLYLRGWEGAWPHPDAPSLAADYTNLMGCILYALTGALYQYMDADVWAYDTVYISEFIAAVFFLAQAVLYTYAWYSMVPLHAPRKGLHWRDLNLWANLLNLLPAILYLCSTAAALQIHFATRDSFFSGSTTSSSTTATTSSTTSTTTVTEEAGLEWLSGLASAPVPRLGSQFGLSALHRQLGADADLTIATTGIPSEFLSAMALYFQWGDILWMVDGVFYVAAWWDEFLEALNDLVSSVEAGKDSVAAYDDAQAAMVARALAVGKEKQSREDSSSGSKRSWLDFGAGSSGNEEPQAQAQAQAQRQQAPGERGSLISKRSGATGYGSTATRAPPSAAAAAASSVTANSDEDDEEEYSAANAWAASGWSPAAKHSAAAAAAGVGATSKATLGALSAALSTPPPAAIPAASSSSPPSAAARHLEHLVTEEPVFVGFEVVLWPLYGKGFHLHWCCAYCVNSAASVLYRLGVTVLRVVSCGRCGRRRNAAREAELLWYQGSRGGEKEEEGRGLLAGSSSSRGSGAGKPKLGGYGATASPAASDRLAGPGPGPAGASPGAAGMPYMPPVREASRSALALMRRHTEMQRERSIAALAPAARAEYSERAWGALGREPSKAVMAVRALSRAGSMAGPAMRLQGAPTSAPAPGGGNNTITNSGGGGSVLSGSFDAAAIVAAAAAARSHQRDSSDSDSDSDSDGGSEERSTTTTPLLRPTLPSPAPPRGAAAAVFRTADSGGSSSGGSSSGGRGRGSTPQLQLQLAATPANVSTLHQQVIQAMQEHRQRRVERPAFATHSGLPDAGGGRRRRGGGGPLRRPASERPPRTAPHFYSSTRSGEEDEGEQWERLADEQVRMRALSADASVILRRAARSLGLDD